MTPTQREAALRLIECGEPSNRLVHEELEAWADDAHALLRELAAETVHRCPACDSAETSDRHEWMCNECGEYFEVTP